MKFIRYSDSAGRRHYGAEQIEGIGKLTNPVALEPTSA